MIPSPATKSLLIRERLPELQSLFDPCRLCPRECLSHRTQGETGECGITDKVIVSSFHLHLGEEHPLSGTRGSGTIFLCGCNLHCAFCQNWLISQNADGFRASPDELAQLMLDLQAAGAHNINWVSPTHVVLMLLEGLRIAYDNGLDIPLAYNTGGYDSVETLRLLDGIVDIYMPDMKYGDSKVAEQLSSIQDYVLHNQEAVMEMYRQVGSLQLDADGIAYRGVLVRHLILPNNQCHSDNILQFLDRQLPGRVHINIMDQYRPYYKASMLPSLNRRLTTSEYQSVVALANERSSLRIID